MRQDELTREDDRCHHGYYFGATCEWCDVELKFGQFFAALVDAVVRKYERITEKLLGRNRCEHRRNPARKRR